MESDRVQGRWEYGVMRFQFTGHEETSESERVEFESTLNIWGDSGFELVGVVAERPGILQAIFKKPAGW